jgi:hypothetical protein
MTHAELVSRAVSWLKSMGCPIVFFEMVTLQSEEPDAIGWRNSGGDSYLIECKASRSDFLADQKKVHRQMPGLGQFKYYMCPPGMIKPEELPAKWGLLYCHPKQVELVRGRHPKRYVLSDLDAFSHDHDPHKEMRMMYSALNRLRIDLGPEDFSRRVHMSYSERKKLKPEAFQ